MAAHLRQGDFDDKYEFRKSLRLIVMRTGSIFVLAFVALVPMTQAGKVAASKRCERVVSRVIAFTGASAHDVLEVGASGVDCAKSVVTVSIRLENGLPVAAFAMPLGWLHEEIDLKRPLTAVRLGDFLKAYAEEAQLDIAASTLPAWKADVATPGFEQGLELTSQLSRDSYETLRAAKPNMLCLRDAFEAFVCYVWDKSHRRAEAILRR